MGFWDVLFFTSRQCWDRAGSRRGAQRDFSISLWVLGGCFFLCTVAMVHHELSSLFPEEAGCTLAQGGLRRFPWIRGGWTYWIYTIFYFPVCCWRARAISGDTSSGGAALAQDRTFCWLVLSCCSCGGGAEYHRAPMWGSGCKRGWLSTYVPLLMPSSASPRCSVSTRSVTPFTWANMMPHWSWDTVNFWSQIAVWHHRISSFRVGMSAEIRDPRRTLPRAVLTSGR